MDEAISPYDCQGVSSEGGLRGSAAERLCESVVEMLVKEFLRQQRSLFILFIFTFLYILE